MHQGTKRVALRKLKKVTTSEFLGEKKKASVAANGNSYIVQYFKNIV